jgi:4-alpha-glucanotransferase
VQYVAYGQWADFKRHVNGLGIGIVGDIPIYASFDSSDVWANNHLFQLNTKHIPKRVGGVPPDYFNKNGQLWGNPLYDWDAMKKEKYEWWLSRIENALTIYDVVRIDHFRGLHAYWAVPYANKTAKKGEWLKGPGMDLIRRINARFPDAPLIMEDLGSLDKPVKRFFASTGYPGMRVMQFGFGSDGGNAHLAKNFPTECVAYTGTHDNNTIIGWYGEVTEETRAASFKELGISAGPDSPPSDKEICRAWIESLSGSEAKLVIIPIQDLLYEGSQSRMNVPGTSSPANWTYRVTDESLESLDRQWMLNINKKYSRVQGSPQCEPESADGSSGVSPERSVQTKTGGTRGRRKA